jgi:hypothetical protein
VIHSADIERLVRAREEKGEGVEDWCRRNGVDESVMHELLRFYGWDRRSGIAAIDAFRTGYEARRAEEPKGERSAGWAVGGERYAVQLVVVDTANGHILGDATVDTRNATDLSETYNRIDLETATDRPL